VIGVPDYTVEPLAPRRARFVICVFVLNENGRLHRQLAAMQPYLAGVDLAIADGGSTDGSVAADVLKPFGVTAVLVKRGPGKLSAQMRMAFHWALESGYDGVIVMDGNGKDGPEAIPAFARKLADGDDHVQGSRFIPGGISENLPRSRWWGLKLLHVPLIRWAAGFRYTDTTNGFRAYSRRLLEDPRVAPLRDLFTTYELHYYLAIRAARLGFRVVEIPVARRYPSHGPIPTKISPVRGGLKVIGCLFRAVSGRLEPR
jgi:hypothetical protein